MLPHERFGGLDGLPVALDGSRFADPCHAFVPYRDVQDIRMVRRLARDNERLGELQADGACLDLHDVNLSGRHGAEIETT
jgi:hypothetical protein